MPSEAHDQLLQLLSGEATETELHAAIDHVRSCDDCRAAQQKMGRALDMFHQEAPLPVPVGAAERLLSRVRAGGRLTFFTDQVARLFDLSTDAAAELLQRAQRNEGWEEGPGPGVFVMPVNAGAKLPDSITALVRVEPGARFPWHPHLGPETVMVLEGGFRDSQGVEVWRGEVQQMPGNTEHDFVAFEGVGCVCAAVNALSPVEDERPVRG